MQRPVLILVAACLGTTGLLLCRATSVEAQLPSASVVPAPNTSAIDIERDLGCVPDNPDMAAANAHKINAALAAMHPNGSVTLSNGQTMPALYKLVAPAKEFFILGELRTAARVGGAFHGLGGGSYLVGSADFGQRGIGGAVTRITRIDGDTGGAVLRLCGAGFDLANIQLRGRPLPDNVHSGTTPKTPYGIAIEGRATPATGKHNIHNVTIGECEKAIAFLASHIDSTGQQINLENHADTSLFGRIDVNGCDTVVYSENQQAVGHTFSHLRIGRNRNGPSELVIFDIARGGCIKADHVLIMHPRATLFRVRDYSLNNCRLDAHIYRDRAGDDPSEWLRLFDFVGQEPTRNKRWSVRVTGHISGDPPADQFVRLNGVPGDDIWLDVHNLPPAVARQYRWGGRQ